MPLSMIDHLENLTNHINMVRANCLLLGKRLIAQGRSEFGKDIIARGYAHDNSKFEGIEWEYLHAGKDIPKEKLDLAIRKHVYNNDHHPEFHGGFEYMKEICVAEMACDLFARCQEFGECYRDWLTKNAVEKYKINTDSQQYKWLCGFAEILIENYFVK
jgi:hypothetical protein